MADFYYDRAQYADSANTYEVVTRLTPDSTIGYLGKGAAYWMLGDTKQALLAYERSLELSPSRQAYTNLGMFYYYAGQFQKAADMQLKALEYAEKSVEMSPNAYWMARRLALIQADMGKTKLAVKTGIFSLLAGLIQ